MQVVEAIAYLSSQLGLVTGNYLPRVAPILIPPFCFIVFVPFLPCSWSFSIILVCLEIQFAETFRDALLLESKQEIKTTDLYG